MSIEAGLKSSNQTLQETKHMIKEVMNFSIDPQDATHAVFNVLARKISSGEIEDIRSTLPKDLAELWASSTS